MKTRDLTCIVCPRGCQLHTETDDNGNITVTGFTCPRGKAYAEAELTHPTRTLTTTVVASDGKVVSVRTSAPIPKEMLFDAMKTINAFVLDKNVEIGDVIIKNFMNTDADLLATGNWKK